MVAMRTAEGVLSSRFLNDHRVSHIISMPIFRSTSLTIWVCYLSPTRVDTNWPFDEMASIFFFFEKVTPKE